MDYPHIYLGSGVVALSSVLGLGVLSEPLIGMRCTMINKFGVTRAGLTGTIVFPIARTEGGNRCPFGRMIPIVC